METGHRQPGSEIRWKQKDRKMEIWRSCGIFIEVGKRWPHPSCFSGNENVSIDNLTVTYKYDNLWSLIKFMETYAAHPGDLKDGEDKKPHTLAFSIDTTNKGTDLMENMAAQRKKLAGWLAKLTFPPKPVKSSGMETDRQKSSKTSFIGSGIWKETKHSMYRNPKTTEIGYGMSSAERIKNTLKKRKKRRQ